MAGTATMAGIGTTGATVIGVTGKRGWIRAAALKEHVRAASFAKVLLSIHQNVAEGGENRRRLLILRMMRSLQTGVDMHFEQKVASSRCGLEARARAPADAAAY